MKKLLCLIAVLALALTACAPAEVPTAVPTDAPETVLPKRAALTRVSMLDDGGEWYDKFVYNERWIKDLELDRMMYWYYDAAGLTDLTAQLKSPGGLEDTEALHGITMGHLLSACSMLYAGTGDEWYRETVTWLVTELSKCQQEDGYLLARPESTLALLEDGAYNYTTVGVPYYFVHKIIAGLVDAYRYCGSAQALDMARADAAWVWARNSALSPAQKQRVLSSEYGGLSEALYDLYDITGDPDTLAAARFFIEQNLVDTWSAGSDDLYGRHGNTHIPKATGMVREYLYSGDERYLLAAKNFFDFVADGRTFANGDNSYNECFGARGIEYAYAMDKTAMLSETCNAYNMIKLATYLYEITGEAKYYDFIERALFNAIMGSENKSGGKTYYQPLNVNATKVFNPRRDGFWCCTGTGMENFSKLPQSVYYEQGDTLLVNTYLSSTYTDGTFALELRASDNAASVTVTAAGSKTVCFRVPAWVRSFTVTYDGTVYEAENGTVTVTADFAAGDVIALDMPYKTYYRQTTDEPDAFSVYYGPYLMAATGRLPSNELSGSYTDGWLSDLDGRVSPTSKGYALDVDGRMLPMQKYGLVTSETYTVYFKRVN